MQTKHTASCIWYTSYSYCRCDFPSQIFIDNNRGCHDFLNFDCTQVHTLRNNPRHLYATNSNCHGTPCFFFKCPSNPMEVPLAFFSTRGKLLCPFNSEVEGLLLYSTTCLHSTAFSLQLKHSRTSHVLSYYNFYLTSWSDWLVYWSPNCYMYSTAISSTDCSLLQITSPTYTCSWKGS